MQIDLIHFYVADADWMRDWSIERLGLSYLENRSTCHTITHLVGNANLSIAISSPLDDTSPVADFLGLHPPGVKDIAFRVEELGEIRRNIHQMGIEVLESAPNLVKIRGWGSIDHTIIQDDDRWISAIDSGHPIAGIDHLVLNVAVGDLAIATNWYQQLFGFQVQQTFQIATDRSGLASQALISPDGKIKFNINQPTSANSQIQEFLDFNHGAGIQHIALKTNSIFETVSRFQQQGVTFLSLPAAYYTKLKIRANTEGMSVISATEWATLERLQILVDWEPDQPTSLLMQTFTQPIFAEPTFFFEIIERRNLAQGFGQGNFQALFEAVEQNNFQFYPDIPRQGADIGVVDAP